MEIHSIRCMSSSVSACDRAWEKWSNISNTSLIGWILQDSPQNMPKSKRYGYTWQSHVKIGCAYVKIDVGIHTVKTFLSPKLVQLILNDRRRVWLTTPLLIPWCHKDQTCRKNINTWCLRPMICATLAHMWTTIRHVWFGCMLSSLSQRNFPATRFRCCRDDRGERTQLSAGWTWLMMVDHRNLMTSIEMTEIYGNMLWFPL